MPDSNIRSVLFALALCVICSLLLTSAATGLKGRQEANVLLDKQTNILRAAGLVGMTAHPSGETVIRQFEKRIKPVTVDARTARVAKASASTLDFYLRVDTRGARVEGYVIPVTSRGLWGKIHGFIALDADGETVTGFTVYSHQETPGLGGEIEQAWFQENFIGKKITDPSGHFTGVSIAKGKAADKATPETLPNTVDGISGASLTGKYLSGGLEAVLGAYEPVARVFREGNASRYLESS